MNGTVKKIIGGVVSAIIIFLVMQVLANSNRITAVEVEIQAIKTAINASKTEIMQNRLENREEHKDINAKLDRLLMRGAK